MSDADEFRQGRIANRKLMEGVTLLTLTRGRVPGLRRSIDCARSQDYAGPLFHIIVVDDCDETRRFLETMALPGNTSWQVLRREADNGPTVSHVSRLRNYAAGLVRTKWLAYLDDDNEFEPNHISSLVSCAVRTGCRAVYSQRQLFNPDGTPYLEERFPWWRDLDEARAMYRELCRKGIFQPGSNIMRDRADAVDHPDPARSVDMGAWLLEKELLLEYPFATAYSDDDLQRITTEDDKLLDTFLREGIAIAGTGLPTLKYHLGGYSNGFAFTPTWKTAETAAP